MFLKQVSLEGFKSYAKKIVLDAFDPHFNAITGLNGTGKSNILDGICFVLGLSSLSKARINSLQGFIFKEGQAGVTKALVNLLFDNSDKSASPLGYEDFPEISVTRVVMIGGKNKYLINGITAQQNRVLSLFQSIHLNIQNPHFVIMQGRISQVLSMSPAATLEMIEEVAGTRVYEIKRANAKKIIDKKDSKLEELSNILEKEIEPKLKRLEKDREKFREWQELQEKLAATQKAKSIGDFIRFTERLEKAEGENSEVKIRLTKDEENLSSLSNNRDFNEEMPEINKEEIEKIGSKKKELEKEIIKKELELDSKLKKKEEITLNNTKVFEKVASEKTSLQKINERLKAKRKEHSEKKSSVETLEAKAKLLTTENTGEEILFKLTTSLKEKIIERDSVKPKIKFLSDQLKIKKSFSDEETGKLNKLEDELKQLQKDSSSKKAVLEKFEALEEELRDNRKAEESVYSILKTKKAELSDLAEALPYDPEIKNRFRGLYGIVAELIEVKDSTHTPGIEAAGGGKLSSLVVSSSSTGSQILSEKALKRRSTIILLDKIRSEFISNEEVRGSGVRSVYRADECLNYSSEIEGAVMSVFGKTILCPDSSSAKKVAYSNSFKRKDHKAVTLSGDVFSPAGTISGGYRSSKSSLITKMNKLKTITKIISLNMNEIEGIKRRIRELENSLEGLRKEVYEIRANEAREKKLVEILKSRKNEGGESSEKEIERLKNDISEYQDLMDELENKISELEKKIKELEKFDSNKTDLEEIKKKIISEKKELSKLEKDLRNLQIEHSEKKIIIEDSEKERVNKNSELKILNEESEALSGELEELQKNLSSVKKAEVKENKVLEEKMKKISKLKEQKEKDSKEVKKLKDSISDLKEALSNNSKVIKDCLRVLEKEEIQKVRESLDISKAKEIFSNFLTLHKLKDKNVDLENIIKQTEIKIETLSSKVNKKVFIMQENTVKEFQDLKNKRNKVLKDKKKIFNVIQDLDKQKDKALDEAWRKVNVNFSSIFSTLLPGNSCELKPENGNKLSEGLEIKVKLGDTWKESLTELSGGQRSLLALSLILSLLKFKQAPIYILDEIDAALDLSHTQNIGIMLKRHFSKSQFLVVSLKEGLFKNANVVFRTKFENGISSVTRTKNKGR